jgi:hypothetical protein
MRITTPPQDIVSVLAGAPAVADAIRQAEVKRLAFVSNAERAALDTERQRLAMKYGAESPQAKAATARLELLDKERAGIDAELVRGTIEVPETAANRFVVYGRVLDSAGKGVQGMTVAAIAPNGKALARGVSDERGVFEVQVPVPQSRSGGNTGKAGQSADTTVLFQLQITSRKPRLSFKDDEVFEAAGDRLAYREITVPNTTT